MKIRTLQKNQYVIIEKGNIFFISYNSTIAKIDKNGKLTMGKDFDYSNTTKKYLVQFFREYKNDLSSDFYKIIEKGLEKENLQKAIRKAIENKQIKLTFASMI